MQDDRGLKRLLSVSWIYELFQNLVGAGKARRWLAHNCWQLRGGEKVVDVGCGTGIVRRYLPADIEYAGFDVSEKYIARARQTFAQNGTFLVGTAGDFLPDPDPRLCGADLVMCMGLLHHLNDEETLQVLQLADKILRPGGRLVCWEPAFLLHQDPISRWLMGRDRGRNVRTEREWKTIAAKVFTNVSTSIVTALLRVPYVHIVIECRKEA
jgi:SAM-dependent methyltransferase